MWTTFSHTWCARAQFVPVCDGWHQGQLVPSWREASAALTESPAAAGLGQRKSLVLLEEAIVGPNNNPAVKLWKGRAETEESLNVLSVCFFFLSLFVWMLGCLLPGYRALLGNSAVHSVLQNNQKEESEAVLWAIDLNEDIHVFPADLPSALSVVVYLQDRKIAGTKHEDNLENGAGQRWFDFLASKGGTWHTGL